MSGAEKRRGGAASLIGILRRLKRFHFGSFAEDPTEDSSDGQKENRCFQAKRYFSLAVARKSRRDSTSRDAFWLCAALNLLNLSLRYHGTMASAASEQIRFTSRPHSLQQQIRGTTC